MDRISLFLLDISRVLLLFWVAARLAWETALGKLHFLPRKHMGPPKMIRLALERLGVTYLKLGQYLATRFDLLPEGLYRELTRLFEDVSPLGFDEVRGVVESELKGPLESVFLKFDSNPIASASVAQVHEARTISGERVAVKVQRPGIERLFMADLRNLARLATLADRLKVFGSLSAIEVVNQFGMWTNRELDFRIEARTAVVMAKYATANEIVPRIFLDLTTARVLTMEFVEGVSLAKIAELLDRGRVDLVRAELPNLDFEKAGRNLAFAALHQLFVTGIFHGDPHPGNILIRNDNQIAFVDFGIFGELTSYEREALAGYIENVALGRINESFHCFEQLTFPSQETDIEQFESEGRAVFRRWYQVSQDSDSPVHERHLGRYTAEIFDVVRRNHVRMSMDTLLFWRTLNALDSSALRLSGHFDLLRQLRNFFEEIRPAFVERLVHALSAELQAPDATSGILAITRHTRDMLQLAVRGDLTGRSIEKEAQAFAKRANGETKSMAAAIIAVSLLLLGINSHTFLVFLIIGGALLAYAWGGVASARRSQDTAASKEVAG